MKKILFTVCTAIFLAGSATSVVISQTLNNRAKSSQSFVSENDSFFWQSNSIKNPDALYLNDVPSKAIRHFNQTYVNVGSAKWSRLIDGKGGFGACFTNDGIQTSVLYDKGGNYEYSFREYFEGNLPREIRHRVKSVYYDFTIQFIKEVNMQDNTGYLITLEDKTSWKNILVTEDETVVLKEVFKTSQSSPGN